MGISRRSARGHDVTNPEYMSAVSTAQSIKDLRKSAKPLTDRDGRDIKDLGGKTRGRWYDAGNN
ncbi:hypothetical protein AB0M79_15030 [Polymorphospora sp. NPDC051019]|uniref:hypothetical protein n=1 Tax=Polymorphospora sp. NPDC051019 TaxID=3155725 RepID=UPI0034304C72